MKACLGGGRPPDSKAMHNCVRVLGDKEMKKHRRAHSKHLRRFSVHCWQTATCQATHGPVSGVTTHMCASTPADVHVLPDCVAHWPV